MYGTKSASQGCISERESVCVLCNLVQTGYHTMMMVYLINS